jgi:hypothetical protein
MLISVRRGDGYSVLCNERSEAWEDRRQTLDPGQDGRECMAVVWVAPDRLHMRDCQSACRSIFTKLPGTLRTDLSPGTSQSHAGPLAKVFQKFATA